MPLPLLPLVVASFIAAAYHQTSKDKSPPKGVLTPVRQMIFDTAMNETREPEKLRILAKSFSEQGLPYQAEMLEKRAKLRELPPDVSKQRRDIFKKAMNSQNPSGVHQLANVFEKQGATGAAAALRKYAASLPPVPVGTSPVATPVVPVMPPQPEPPHEATVHGDDVGDDYGDEVGEESEDSEDSIPNAEDLTETEEVVSGEETQETPASEQE